jgi:hypothetical protein
MGYTIPATAVINTDLFSGTFKAKEVKEGNTVVYRNEGTTNIIPGYSKYRIAFIAGTGKRTVRITEYNGEVFEGIWTYKDSDQSMTFSSLSPRPQVGNLVFQVTTAEIGLLVLNNTIANPKTGDTMNQYTLIPE